MSLRARLVLSHMLPVLIVAPLMALALLLTIESQLLLDDLAADLDARAAGIAERAAARPELFTEPEAAAAFLRELTGSLSGPVYLFSPSGALISVSAPAADALVLEAGELADAQAGESVIRTTYSILDPQTVVIVPVLTLDRELLGIFALAEELYGTASVLRQLRMLFLAMVALELLAGLVVALLLAGRTARPINRAAQGVIDIAAGRPYAPQPPAGPLEIRQLSEAVNTLSERLHLLEEGRRRSLANIVHEIGRPLGAVQSAIHVLRRGAGDDPALREELLGGMAQELARLSPLLDDLAQLHGQGLSREALNLQPTALSEWLPGVLLPWRAAAAEKGLEWRADIPPGLPTISIDPERMAQVLGNVLSNAVKYTPAPGSVSVAVELFAGDEVRINVSDTGPGIHPDEQERVFEPFYRSERERRFPQGLGVGLTIARELTTAHGGRLLLESEVGAGCRFVVCLPVGS